MANEFIARKGLIVSGSTRITGSLSVTTNITAQSITGSLLGTASIANEVRGGTSRYIPLWTGSSGNELTASIMYQTSKGIFIGYDTVPHTHSLVGETLAVHSGETGVKNVIYAHGTSDDSYRINIRNVSSGVSASTNFIATADTGNDDGGYIRMGINSSTYTRDDEIGNALDAYLFTTGSDLLIGNLSPDKRIILFTGPGNATNNARVFIDPSGSVGINTSEVIAGAPDALRVKAVPSVSTFNVITALGLTDDYAQINMKNTGVGNSVSSDIVATANNGDENTNFINMGINGETYTGTIGGPNDSYVYSTGGHLHLGAIDPGEEIMLFVGGEDVMMTTKLTLRDTNQHTLSGSLDVTGSLNVLLNISSSGDIAAGTNLRSNYSVGDEGGEIQLARPQTNTSISGSVVIDVNGNRLRIFESNLPNRGGYWDITSLASGVGTNLANSAGNSFGTISVAGQSDVVADQANDTLTLVAGTNITLTTNAGTDTITINASGTGNVFPYDGTITPAVISGSLIISGSTTQGLFVTGSTIFRDNLTVNGGTLSVNAATNRTTVSGSLAVTGSTDILGNFTATTKSFKINHQRLSGKSLVYGVLEGPEHAVYVRGRLTDNNNINLPEEWEWLIDESSMTVQLTPIGAHQKLYVDSITNKQIIVKVDSLFDRRIDCFYFIQATRKDVAELITVE